MSKKVLIAIIIILLLVIGFLVLQMIGGLNISIGIGGKGPMAIASARLEMFPAGTEVKPGMQGEVTDTFKVGEMIALSGEATVPGKTNLGLQIFDSEGNLIQGGGPGMGMEIKSGGFGMCCFSPPSGVGKYNLKLLLNNQEAKNIPFEVVE